MFIDTHAHLFLKDNPFDDFDPEKVFNDSLKAGVGQIWLASTAKDDIKKNIEFAKKRPKNVKAWVGFHPENYKEFDLTWLNQILDKEFSIFNFQENSKQKDSSLGNRDSSDQTLSDPLNDVTILGLAAQKRKQGLSIDSPDESGLCGSESGMTERDVVGVGEVGVDLNWNDNSTAKAQQQVFEEQIKLANKYSLPVAIHSRDAFDETIEVMQSFKNTRFVWHCFNLDKKQTEITLSQFSNLYVGVNAIVTYKSGSYIWDSLHQVPSSELLIETDCPFLKPRQQLRSLGGQAQSKASSLGGQSSKQSLSIDSGSESGMTEDSVVSDFFKLKYNTPYGVIPVYSFVAQKLNISVEELEKLVEKNCLELTKINN